MSDRPQQEKEFRIRPSLFDSLDLLPQTPEQALKFGAEYYKEFLEPVLPGLASEVAKIQQETGVPNDKTACVFLERDARPAMLAWHELTTGSSLTSLSIPISATQMDEIFELYPPFENANLGLIKNPDEWSRTWAHEIDPLFHYFGNSQNWVDAIRESHGKKLANTKLINVVDIGYHGSAVETGRYLLKRAFPDKTVKSILLYRYSDEIPIRCVKSDETTWYAEKSIPHTTSGYALSAGKYRYLRPEATKNSIEIENQFYRGVIKAARKDKERFRLLSSPTFWARSRPSE
ncbi:MAG: hypothetical protein HYV90_05200 [Candidatus Woesebacteria bacterium]|nr:MAG: hypothetical protein HYV90_05200 [Candidatus Woesebacteria bacterium]